MVQSRGLVVPMRSIFLPRFGRLLRQQLAFSSSSVQVEHHHHPSTTMTKSQCVGVTTPNTTRLPDDGLSLGDFVSASSRKSLKEASESMMIPSFASSTQTQHSFHIKTYGCQMNVNDTDIVRAVLLEKGFVEARCEEEATIWLTNTCAIRDKAEQKVVQRLYGLRKRKQQQQQDGKRIVGVLGCMAERLQEELLQEQMADLVVGPDAYRDLPRLLDELLLPEHPISSAMNVQLSLEETYQDIVPIRDASSPTPFSAFVSIQRGCSNRCSFCIVPFTRGQERSRPLESIVAEVTQLLEEDNLKEVTLLGQNVNSYHDRSDAALAARPLAITPGLSNSGFRNRIRRPTQGGYTFVDLVERISDLSPELRVRFTSPHPKDYPEELLHLMAERPNVCNQLHLPAQSGSTTMLKRMKRGYSREAYLELVETVHSIIPDVALSSDFIAGFCGETDEEHRDTVTLLEQVEYEQAFLFAYSLREKTHAHRTLQDNVPPELKQQRLQELIDTFRSRVHSKNERVEVGKFRLVLVEGPAKRQMSSADSPSEETWHGRTDQNKRILFPVYSNPSDSAGSALVIEEGYASHALTTKTPPPPSTTTLVPGEYAVVEVTEAKGHTLRGRLLWKTTLANFSKMDATILSKLGKEEIDGFKEQLLVVG